jgi:DNA polymerase I-like protein with 3'-5' exonuclease and polymerase domains
LLKQKVRRRDKDQYIGGAVASALYGAAFGIQSANMRAAANHVIQSTGATITKRVQRRIWDIQPSGVSKWRVVPMNIHDELMAPTRPEYIDQVRTVVYETVESFRPVVPLIKMDWGINARSWAEAK